MNLKSRISQKDIFSKRVAVNFIVLLGIVSLFADITYEGARSITGQYLSLLGASAAAVGLVAGFGELIGYGLRLLSGIISDRTGKYWTITIIGYGVNLLAVPLLALAGHWETAAVLLITERVGKAIRTPARDAMLSHAAHTVGRGWGFGLHEAMDQIGAVLGPLVVAVVLSLRGTYQAGFALLLIPAAVALTVLFVAMFLYPRPRDLEVTLPALEPKGFPRAFWYYLAAVALVAAGYADFPLISYHFEKESIAADRWIPVFYSLAMGIDALSALVFGRLFDRRGIPVLAVVSLFSAFFAPLVFLGGFKSALLGMVLWGAGMGAQESIMRAAVAGMVPSDRRGTAYGLFNTGYGLFWFVGSALMGFLYDRSVLSLVLFSAALQIAAVPVFLSVRKHMSKI